MVVGPLCWVGTSLFWHVIMLFDLVSDYQFSSLFRAHEDHCGKLCPHPLLCLLPSQVLSHCGECLSVPLKGLRPAPELTCMYSWINANCWLAPDVYIMQSVFWTRLVDPCNLALCSVVSIHIPPSPSHLTCLLCLSLLLLLCAVPLPLFLSVCLYVITCWGQEEYVG